MDWLNCAQNNNTTFSNIPNTPDITILDVSNKNVTIGELACFDLYMDICFNTWKLYVLIEENLLKRKIPLLRLVPST